MLYVQDAEVEAKVYEQMSLVSSAVGFSWSKWSSKVGEQQFVVKACECVTQQVGMCNRYIYSHYNILLSCIQEIAQDD